MTKHSFANFNQNKFGTNVALGSSLVKPSELFGSVKRSITRTRPKCQCKHHQQKLLAKQEEQRQKLQEQLRQRGDKRTVLATTFNKAFRQQGQNQNNQNIPSRLSRT